MSREENHKYYLSKLCRVCGEKVFLKKGYVTAVLVSKYKEVLLERYGMQVDIENEYDYPKTLCVCCSKHLYRLSKSTSAEIGHLKAFSFEPHSDDCTLCKRASGATSTLNIISTDKIMKDAGYLQVSNKDTKRVYVKQTFNITDETITTSSSFVIRYDNTWSCSVYGKKLQSISSICFLPTFISDDNIHLFRDFLLKYKVCDGVDGCTELIQKKVEINNGLNAIIENHEHSKLGDSGSYRFVRSHDCVGFVDIDKMYCINCKLLKNQCTENLRRIKNKLKTETEVTKKRTSDSSTVNLKYLSRDELVAKIQECQNNKRKATRKLAVIQNRISNNINSCGISTEGSVIDNEQHNLLTDIISKHRDSPFDEDLPQHLLWQQQKLQASKENSRGMRWHPLIIRWCLSIFITSPAAYKQMSNKDLNFLHLPSVNTLKQYTNFTPVQTGFNVDIIEKLATEIKIENASPREKQVILAFDEMQIKSNLVFHKASGKLVGFTDIGSMNNEFLAFQSLMNEEVDINNGQNLATHVLVFMTRGIFTSLTYPFGYFATRGMTSSQLYACAIEALRVLSSINLEVRAVVSDGAPSNRKFYKLMSDEHYTLNPHNDDNALYFFSDVPHLLKTTRNCFENSKWNKNVRNLHLDGQDISWQHIIDIYENDLSLGLRKLHKLTEEHVNLSPRSRMTVKLAAQVLSQSTANALKSQGRYDTKSTIEFVIMFDRVFDCLNVSQINKSRFNKKELAPYESPDDWRFKFLKDDFLDGFLKRWEDQVDSKGNLKRDEKNRQLLSLQTRDGWKLTVSSFVDLGKELLLMEDVSFLLSEKFSQDPLEEHFGRQRRRGGCNDNPNLLEFGRQEITLNVMKSDLLRDIKGNTRGADREKRKLDVNDTRSLPKQKKR